MQQQQQRTGEGAGEEPLELVGLGDALGLARRLRRVLLQHVRDNFFELEVLRPPEGVLEPGALAEVPLLRGVLPWPALPADLVQIRRGLSYLL